MALKFRLSRYGAKKKPYYRIVVADSRFPRDGRVVENVGSYDPLQNPARVTLDRDKIHAWYEKGATPTKTVLDIFKREGIFKNIPE